MLWEWYQNGLAEAYLIFLNLNVLKRIWINLRSFLKNTKIDLWQT